MNERTRLAVAWALSALVMVTGCSAPSDTAADPAPESSFQTDEPETEQTTATEPADETDGGGTVAVELPGLPIGGNTSVVSDTLQCVDVGWTAPPELPGRLAIAVTGVGFAPSEGFQLSSEPCPGGAASCLAEDFRLTADGPRCVVAVTWTGPTLDEERLMFFTAGTLSCPAERLPECESFRDAVATEGSQAIALDPAPAELGTDEPGTGEPETGESGTGESGTGEPETSSSPGSDEGG